MRVESPSQIILADAMTRSRASEGTAARQEGGESHTQLPPSGSPDHTLIFPVQGNHS